MKRNERRDKTATILWWQLREIQKVLGVSASIQEAIIICEIIEKYGTHECYVDSFKCSFNKPSTFRHIQDLESRGIITYERKFRGNKTKYIELTEKGEHLMARLIRLSKGEMA